MSEDTPSQTGQIRVACLGDNAVADALRERTQSRSPVISVTVVSDRSAIPPETDCFVVTKPACVSAPSRPTILYTHANPVELDCETVAQFDAVVRRDRPESLDRLAEQIHLATRQPSRQHGPTQPDEQIIQAVGAPVCTLDRDGRIQYVNGQFEDRTGYSATDSLGRRLDLILDPDGMAQMQDALTRIVDDVDATATLERQIEPRSGEPFPTECQLTGLPQIDADRDSVAVAVFHDITRLKQREQRLSKFASVVSHDLRNPMDVALGRAEMLPEIADVDDRTEKHLDDIYDSLKRMERLIQDVLTLTREREDSIDTEPVSVADVASTAWENVATDGSDLQIDTDQEIEADSSRLLRVFENLFRNSVVHGCTNSRPAGDDTQINNSVTVRVDSLDTSGPTTGFRVTDDGPGIPDEHCDEIFEDGFTTAQDGTGLGLAIVREVAHAHGWAVSVCDSPTHGAQFEFRNVEPAVRTEDGG